MNLNFIKSRKASLREIKCLEKRLKTTNGYLNIRIPCVLSEITIGQIMELQGQPSLTDFEAISILSGVPVTDLQNICNADELQVFGDAILSISHQITHLYNSNTIPKKISFLLGNDCVMVNVINNLSVEPAGAFMAAREIIGDEINEHVKLYGEDDWQARFNPSLKACCLVLAHYFFCRATGKKYNEYEVEEFYDHIKNLRVTEALPIAKYFFSSFPALLRPKTSFFHRFHRSWKKRQEFSRLKNLSTSIL